MNKSSVINVFNLCLPRDFQHRTYREELKESELQADDKKITGINDYKNRMNPDYLEQHGLMISMSVSFHFFPCRFVKCNSNSGQIAEMADDGCCQRCQSPSTRHKNEGLLCGEFLLITG